MDYSKYYTPFEIATILINELNIPTPQKVVDICCGSCNLLFAAKNKWGNIRLYGTDIVDHSINKNIIFEKKDGRQFSVEHPREFSLAIANPPFGSVDSKKQIPDLFVNEYESIKTSRLEIEMLIANLNILQNNGVLLIILPSSFVEAETYKKIRQIVANNYFVESIIKLDESTFGASRINSYALIIHKESQKQRVAKLGYSAKKSIKYTSYIDSENLKNGSWVSNISKDDALILDIKRGNISSSSFITNITNGQPVLHTAKSSTEWQPNRRYISKQEVPTVFAEKGDIIVSRIGKSAGQWCLYEGSRMAITDCLYRIKDPGSYIFNKINGKKFNKNIKGVATRYITIADFCSWISSISE